MPNRLATAFPALFQRRRGPRLSLHAEQFQGVLGTRLEVQILATSRVVGPQAVQAALAEIDRLERVFSRFSPTSDLNRWLAGAAPSDELSALLRQAERWRLRTCGAFHPGSEALTLLWRDAERTGRPPSAGAIRGVLDALLQPVWEDSPGWRPAVSLNLNAFAKGHIADCAAEAARSAGAWEVLINLGGDLRHLDQEGNGGVVVQVMDPAAPQLNAAPLTCLKLAGRGLATSGGAFRGFNVGGQRFSHLLNPRTGQPAEAILSASVLAPTCADADALATAFSVLSPEESLALADGLPDVSCLLVLAGGGQRSSANFPPSILTPT